MCVFISRTCCAVIFITISEEVQLLIHKKCVPVLNGIFNYVVVVKYACILLNEYNSVEEGSGFDPRLISFWIIAVWTARFQFIVWIELIFTEALKGRWFLCDYLKYNKVPLLIFFHFNITYCTTFSITRGETLLRWIMFILPAVLNLSLHLILLID